MNRKCSQSKSRPVRVHDTYVDTDRLIVSCLIVKFNSTVAQNMAELLSIDELKSRAKRQKSDIASLKAAVSTLSSLNISEEKVCKLSQEEREIWLVAKFGCAE